MTRTGHLTKKKAKDLVLMKIPCSGVILSGGLNRRYGGTTKAFISIGGRKILDRLCDLFQDVFEDVILVTNEPLAYLDRDIEIVTDLLPIRSSLTGIHAGLFYCKTPFAFFSACDAPFLKKSMIKFLLDSLEQRFDVIIPETSHGLEPLCAVYSKQCLKPVERNLVLRQFKIDHVFKMLRIKKIPESELRSIDPELISFFNVNTPEDYKRAQTLLPSSG